MLVIVRTSSTRGARLGTRAGTCTAENEPCEVRKFELSEMLNLNFEISNLLFAAQISFPGDLTECFDRCKAHPPVLMLPAPDYRFEP